MTRTMINQIDDIVKALDESPDCSLAPSSGMPKIREEHALPRDVERFYDLCGGVTMFSDADCPVRIVGPEEMLQSNTVILVGLTREQLQQLKREPSWSWYLIALGDTGEYISIDLDPSRLGYCYYGFWDSHAMKGFAPVVAVSFTDLLTRLMESKGRGWYWEQPEYPVLGDAYDLFDLE